MAVIAGAGGLVGLAVAMPAADETMNSEPRGATTMRVHAPALAGTGATLKLQARNPVTREFSDLLGLLNNGTNAFAQVALPLIVESTTVTIPAAWFGGGDLRFVASADQSSAPSTVDVAFGR
jgi:hypothetical protein